MLKNKKTTEFEFQFLKDQPLKTDDELESAEFGHKEIAKTLSKIVEKCSTPFSIGLFGKWGSGKSTIANLLKKELKTKSIPTIIFDVWKHEKDALMRTFLEEMVSQLEDKKEYGKKYFKGVKLDERLRRNVSTTSEKKTRINLRKIGYVVPFFILSIIVYLISTVLESSTTTDLLSGTGIILFIISSIGLFTTWFWQNLTQFFTTDTETIHIDKFQDPTEFETQFGEILKQLTNERILIVFDNIDRVTCDTAVDVLKTIKTFLEPKDIEIENKKVIYLIPCDSRAITKHIQRIYFTENLTKSDESQEFLRKFFNSIVWIPDFIPNEMEAYTRKSLKDTKVKKLDNDKISWIISKAFKQNPRQVKQFVNTLLANFLLVKEREGHRDFQEDFISNNLPQLTKFLLLRRKFPTEMETLREKNIIYLEKIDFKQILTQDPHNVDEFIKFINDTESVIPLRNLQVFYTLRRSEIEKRFPGIEEFFDDLENYNRVRSLDYLKQIENLDTQIEDFSLIVKDRLSQIKNPESINKFIDTLLRTLEEINTRLTDSVYTEIYNHLTTTAKEQLYTISPLLLHRQLAY